MAYFWGVYKQSELDLLTEIQGDQIGFEFKFSDAPKLSSSIKNAMRTLKLHKLWVKKAYETKMAFKTNQ